MQVSSLKSQVSGTINDFNKMIKKTLILLCGVFVFFYTAVAQDQEGWNISKSTHFIVYYKNAPEEFIGQVVNKSEDCYVMITEAMGFSRFDFWLWDNRAKIYIYDNAGDYHRSTGQPNWSNAVAVPVEKKISTFVDSRGFFDSLLPHEMGHIIFREMIGFDNYAVPLWLEEGVASYQENLRVATADLLVQEANKSNKLMPFNQLFQVNLRGMSNTSEVQLVYAQSASVVGFLINEFGSGKFVEFCQHLRDKKDFNEAMGYVYNFSNAEELELAWREYLRK